MSQGCEGKQKEGGADGEKYTGRDILVCRWWRAYPKRFTLHHLALARTESSQGIRKGCFHLKNNPNIGPMIKGEKNGYVAKYPELRKQGESISKQGREL